MTKLQQRQALAQRFPLAQSIEFDDGVWWVTHGDDQGYFEERASHVFQSGAWRLVGMTTVDCA